VTRSKKKIPKPVKPVDPTPGTFVRLPAPTRAWLGRMAAAQGGRSVSSIVREIVEDAMEEHEANTRDETSAPVGVGGAS
jgi:hypothetical protein